jgi:putative oxidoreductase
MKPLAHRCRRLVSEDWHGWYTIPLTLAVGFGFVEHGYAKIIHDPAVFIGILHALRVPAATVLGWATILVELFGGAAVLFGLFIPLATVPMAVVLLVAILRRGCAKPARTRAVTPPR